MSLSPLRFYRDALSGHCHRVELLLSMLQVPFEPIDVDIARGDLQRPEFLALNPFGQVPVIVDQGIAIADSTAILVYLAKRYGNGSWLPVDPLGSARVQRWLSAASGPVARDLARARLIAVFGGPFTPSEAIATSHAFLHALEDELLGRTFLAADHATIADLACYPYIAHAPEGHVALDIYPHVRNWLNRIECLPGFIPMQAGQPPRPMVASRTPPKGVGRWLRRRRK